MCNQRGDSVTKRFKNSAPKIAPAKPEEATLLRSAIFVGIALVQRELLTHRVAAAGQWLAQLMGVVTLLGLVLPLTYGLNLLLNLVCRHRVAPEGERQGLDLYELGAGAYPEFVTHTEEFTQR